MVAHPGHELRIHGWLERCRPRVFVLTDGSGRAGSPRLASTARVLAQAGASLGGIFGRLSDRAIYAAILAGDVRLFRGLVAELAAACADLDEIVGDAAEGYNPAHDVCRLLIEAAVTRARRLHGRAPRSFEFPLVGPPRRPDAARAGSVELTLDDRALARKLSAARRYAELDGEVEAALRAGGPEAFRVDVLDPAAPWAPPARPPFYEEHGARRVAEGAYARVLRHREHVRPLAHALLVEGW